MANEIQMAVQLAALKSGAQVGYSTAANEDMTGSNLIQTTQPIGTSWEALTFGDISGAPAALLVKNLDATNFVELALANDGTQKFAKIKKGKAILITPSTATIYAKADTAEVVVMKVACEA